ncbi:hypothetical protein ADL22_12355 [Streptomyces sp. NRRL F-4489]|uniref:hypothetical protein n=1 Tax=Streptomyces sp. NRRL F-4489 TaxID=1609095 RepID=UPI000749FEE8|nr:hypothetical protein [Streptomyces sp. NRRL F-4489]KUL44729.1 hypothetical protein ADL22_12355 [Streptomyces sp. NRRL F-4489]
MPSHYPKAIRRWPQHANQRDYVMAEHVNEIQDEIAGISSTLGVMPTEYLDANGNTVSYTTVDSRLDIIQREQERLRYYQDGLLDAAKTGWNLPVCSLRSSGTSIPQTVNQGNPNHPVEDWHPILFDRAVIDPLGMAKQPTYTLTCPKTGWWIISVRTMMWVPAKRPQTKSTDHAMYTRVNIEGVSRDVATDGDSAPLGIYGYHRNNPVYSGPWYQGEKLSVEIRHMGNLRIPAANLFDPIGPQTVFTWAGFTYIRALPQDMVTRPDWDADPLTP